MTSHASSPAVSLAQRRSGDTLLRLALLPFLLLALLELRAPIDLSVGDQAQYILHARSILTGRGYTDDGYIYTTRFVISPQAYPPGLPLLIAGVEILGGSLLAVRLVMIATTVLFLYLAGRYLATRDDPVLGPASILMCAFIPNFTLFASGLYSDSAMAVATWGCCLVVDRPGEWSRGRIAALTALGVVAISFRTVGVALVPGLIIHQAWRTWRHKEPWTRAIVPLVAWVAIYVAINQLLPVTQGYAQQIAKPRLYDSVMSSAVGLIKLLLLRVLAYRDIVEGMLFVPTYWRPVNIAYHAAALVALVIGTIGWVKRAGVRFLFCFVLTYVGILLLLPWPVTRYLWPFAPLVWFTTLNGVRIVLQAVGVDRVRAAELPVLAAASIAFATVMIGPDAHPLVGIGDLPEGRALYAAVEREAATSPVRAMFSNPRDAARLRGVSAMLTPRLTPDSLLAVADSNKITHAILGSMGRDTGADRVMHGALRKHPERFQRVYENSLFTLFRVVPPASQR
jgi:hypothetical protein